MSAETQQERPATCTKFAYKKPPMTSQQRRTSSSHLIPPISEFMRLESSWTPCPPKLQLVPLFPLEGEAGTW